MWLILTPVPFADYDVLFSRLASVQGDSATRADFVREIIAESRRLKRKHLVERLEAYLDGAGAGAGCPTYDWPLRNGQLRQNGPR